jgi:uncharacterized membrane protein
MSKNSKVMIGLLSFLPIILLIVLFIMFFSLFPRFFEWEQYEPAPQEIFSAFGPFIILAIAMSILSFGLLIFFIIHLIKHKNTNGTERAVWILAFLLGGIISYPIYWYMKIWREDI